MSSCCKSHHELGVVHLLAGGGSDSATDVLDVVRAELNIDALDEPVATLLDGVENGDAADAEGSAVGDLGEGGGPDEADLQLKGPTFSILTGMRSGV